MKIKINKNNEIIFIYFYFLFRLLAAFGGPGAQCRNENA
jgi:hypothetical protein